VAAFLHENLLSFIDGDAIADVAGCLEQLSAADALASGRRWGSEWRRLLTRCWGGGWQRERLRMLVWCGGTVVSSWTFAWLHTLLFCPGCLLACASSPAVPSCALLCPPCFVDLAIPALLRCAHPALQPTTH
jgi:hypothetical protein